MFQAYFANNWAQEVWGLPVGEGSVAATKTVTVTSAPTVGGTYHLYIGGRHVPVPLLATDTTTTAATAIATAINADKTLPVTAVGASAICTLTVKSKGSHGADIVVSSNYYGAVGGESMPTGFAVTIADGVAGTGVPTFTTAISNLGESPAEYVCMPFTDATSLAAWKAEFGFGDTGRWGWVRQLYGHVFSAVRGAYGTIVTFAASAGNNPQLSVMAIEALAQSPIWEWAAAYTAKAARGLSIDPARPLQSLHLENIIPAKGQDRFLLSQLNILSLAGIATQRTLQDGVPMITRETTTYTLNLYGNTDDAYTDVTTLATLAKLLRNQRQAITSKYPRHKLANDGTRFGAGQAIVTPKIIKAELVAQYRMDEFNGLVEDAINFKNNLIVERDPNDPNRVNVLYPPDLVNQLRVFAVLAQFRLQFNRGIDLAII
jgi:phage tail sheath gpL-like